MSQQINPPTDDRSKTPPLEQPRPTSPPWKQFLVRIILPFLILLVALAAWMYVPAIQEIFMGTPTPMELPPSPTPTLTAAPTNTPTPAPTAPPTATAMPASAYQKDPSTIDPHVPGFALDAVVLNEDTSVTVDPPFDQLQWYSSEQIAQQIGRVISEPFYATVGSGTAIWKMDVPLQPGLYEIYVLDTVYSSAGSLDFRVMLGERELTPLLGSQHVQYSSQSGYPAQTADEWATIGLYDLDSTDLLSILTTWEARDMSTIVAIDRMLITRQPDSPRPLLAQLPANMPKYVIDDTAAQIESSATWFTSSDLPAWGGDFQIVINPEYNSQVTWTVPCQVPSGYYDIWVWAPEMEGEADLTYKILINGEESQSTLIASIENFPDNQWVSLGTWEVSSSDTAYVKLGLMLDIPRGSVGEIGVDAVAFIYRQ